MLLLLAMKRVIPRFENTRRVQIKQVPSGEWVIFCSCRMLVKYGHTCRHVYKILKRKPKFTDAKIRWSDGYAHHYGKNEQMSEHYIKMSAQYDKLGGIPITQDEVGTIDASMEIGHGDVSLEFFTSSLDKLKLRGCSYWQKLTIAQEFPDIDPQCFACCDSASQASTQATSQAKLPASQSESDVSTADMKLPSVPQASMLQSGVFGCSQTMHSQSEYMVPSQQMACGGLQECTNNDDMNDDDDADSISGTDLMPEADIDWSKYNPHSDYTQFYAQLTKLAKANGKAGDDVLKKGFRDIRRQLNALSKPKLNSTGMNTGGTLVKYKKNHKRLTKACSPDRSKKRMKSSVG
jgi:hypothetical protein